MFPDMEDAEINSRLVGYCSDQVTILCGGQGGREGVLWDKYRAGDLCIVKLTCFFTKHGY